MSGRTVRLLLLGVALVALLAPASAVAAPQPVVSGTVYDSGGLPIPGATIQVSEFFRGSFRLMTTLTANEGGQWTFRGKDSLYLFAFSAAGYLPETRELEMSKGGSYTLDVTLQSAATTGTISGVVVSGAARAPVNGAYVWLYRQNPDGTWPATTPGWGQPDVLAVLGC